MRTRLLFALAFTALCASGLGLTGCDDDDDRPAELGQSPWTTDPDIYNYCKDFCDSLTCENARGSTCRDTCEYWMSGLSGDCNDALRDTYACEAKLSCDEFEAFSADPRTDENCGDEYAKHVTECAPKSPGCDAFCELATGCDPDFVYCSENCRMRQAWFAGYYGDDCVAASEKLYLCEGTLTCGDLDLSADSGYVAPDCQDEHDAFEAACTK